MTPQFPRKALRRGRSVILWENAVIGTEEVRYFVQGLGRRSGESGDFRTLPEAERLYDRIDDAAPKPGLRSWW